MIFHFRSPLVLLVFFTFSQGGRIARTLGHEEKSAASVWHSGYPTRLIYDASDPIQEYPSKLRVILTASCEP